MPLITPSDTGYDQKHNLKNAKTLSISTIPTTIEKTYYTLESIDATKLSLNQILNICHSIFIATKRLHIENKSLGKSNSKNILIHKNRHGIYVAKLTNDHQKINNIIDISNDIFSLRNTLQKWCPLLAKFPLFVQTLSDDDKLIFTSEALIRRSTQIKQLEDYFSNLNKKAISSTFIIDKNIINIIKHNHFTAPMLFELCKALPLPEYLIRDIMIEGDIFDLLPDLLCHLPKHEAVTLVATCPFPLMELEIFIDAALQNKNCKSLFDIIDATKKEYPDFYSKVFEYIKKHPTAKSLLIKTEQPDIISQLFRLSEMVKYADSMSADAYQKILSLRATAHPEEINFFIDLVFNQEKNGRTFDSKLTKTLAFLDSHVSQDKNLYKTALQYLNKKYRKRLINIASEECLGFYSLFGHSRKDKLQASLQLDELILKPDALKDYQTTHPVAQVGKLGEIAKRLIK